MIQFRVREKSVNNESCAFDLRNYSRNYKELSFAEMQNPTRETVKNERDQESDVTQKFKYTVRHPNIVPLNINIWI